MSKVTTEVSFWARVDKTGPCWVWLGYRKPDGYGNVRWHGRRTATHRLSYELANGPIQDGLFVLHRCDNPPCVNPAHLFLGTNADNINDCAIKNRRAYQRGLGFRPKLTPAELSEVRRLRLEEGRTYKQLAEQFGVNITTTWAAVTGRGKRAQTYAPRAGRTR